MRWFRVRATIPFGSTAWTDDETDRVLGHLPGLEVEAVGETLTFLFDVEIPGWATKELLEASGSFEAIAMDQVLRAFGDADKELPSMGGEITVRKFYEGSHHPALDNQREAAELFTQGFRAAKRGLWSESEAAFVQSGRLMPLSITWIWAGFLAWRQQRVAQVPIYLERALRSMPIGDKQELQAGIARFKKGDWHGVEASFRPLLAADPVETSTHLFLCIALIHLGRLDEAGEQLVAGWKQVVSA